MRHRDRRRGVERVVPPRHRQHDIGDLMRGIGLAIAEYDLEAGAAAHWIHIDQLHVRLRIFAAVDDAAILDLAAINSGLSRLIAVDTTSTSAPATFSALWPTLILMPLSRRRLTLAPSDASDPCTV